MTRARAASSARASIRGTPTTDGEPSAAAGTSGHELAPAAAPFVPPYQPSWFDRIMALIDRLPGSYAVWYGVFALLCFALVTLARLVAGMPPFGDDLGLLAFSSLMLGFPAFLLHSLNRTAAGAFTAFEPALQSSDEVTLLRYHLTTAPAVPSFLFSLGGAALALSLLFLSPETRSFSDAIYGPAFAVFFFGALAYFINSHGAYRVMYQLTQVSRIYDRHARVQLGDLGPHFALSRLTSRAAIASILVVSGYLFGFAQLGSLTLSLAVLIPNLLLAGAAFVLPLTGAHRLLEAERYRVRKEANQRMEAALSELHQVIERGKFAEVPPLKDAITALDIELNRLARIPTWPWNPGTLRGVLATVFLPVVIWLIQFGLGRLLG